MQKKINTELDLNDETGPNEALGSTIHGNARGAAPKADNSDVLLHSELTLVKSDICKKIEAEISEVTTTLRGDSSAEI